MVRGETISHTADPRATAAIDFSRLPAANATGDRTSMLRTPLLSGTLF